MSESQDIETATTAVSSNVPDAKTRRYDRQLRLWAATGQAALENARILAIGASATMTSILKNLVLPGIGHFTILDDSKVTPEDAGNNFFFEGSSSIGKSSAEEAVRLLLELNDSVDGKSDTRNLGDVLGNLDGQKWIQSFTLVIAHNLEHGLSEKLSDLLWTTPSESPTLAVVRSAGFLAEFGLQFYEHPIIESHSETAPTLRIDHAFPALREHAMSLDFESMDQTDHAHIPYVVILVRELENWKKSHGGSPPQAYADKKSFKSHILTLKRKFDEENFDEAEAQAYRCWTSSVVPSEISSLFSLPQLSSRDGSSSVFFHLLAALKKFTEAHDGKCLPLSGSLPDMKASTGTYIHLQKLYKAQAEEDKKLFKEYLSVPVEDSVVDTFVKNAHGLKFLRGKKWGALNSDKDALANAQAISPKALATHLSLSALSSHLATSSSKMPTAESLKEAVHLLYPGAEELGDDLDNAVGELARAPTADLPNTAAFLGGLVAQEVIKMITKQYVPIEGVCVVDLVESLTGVI